MESEGGVLAVATQEGRVRVLHPHTGETLHEFQAHRTAVCCLTFSPDGGKLASATYDKAWMLFDVDGTERLRVQGHDGKGACLCETQDGARCPVVGHSRRVDALAFSPGGDRVATGGGDETVMVWSSVTGERSLLLLGHNHAVSSLAFSGDDLLLVSGSCDESVRVWDARTGNILHMLETSVAISRRFQFSRDNQHLTCVWVHPKRMCARVFDLRTGETVASEEPCPGVGPRCCAPRIIALSPDLESTATAGRISPWNSDVCVTVWKARRATSHVIYAKHVTVPGHRCGPGIAWNLNSKGLPARPNPGVAGCICQRGSHPDPACESVGHSARVTSVAFTLDGKAVASGSIDGTCKIWEQSTGELLRSVEIGARVSCVAFGEDWTRRARLAAFAMGLQPRLGAASFVAMLHPELVNMVLGHSGERLASA